MTEHPAAPGVLLPATTTTDHDAVHAAVAVLPIGAFEQHGPSLPLVTDTLIAIAIADAISQHYKVFQLPAITFGCSHEHSAFPGTVSLSPATLAAVVTDIRTSLAQHGISALIGSWRDPNNFGKQWRTVREELGVPAVTTHSFRKTVADLIDSEGLSERVGADQLGHRHVSMTQDKYLSRGRIHPQVADLLDRAVINAE